MKRITTKHSWILALLCAAIAASTARADDVGSVDLKLVPSGMTRIVGFYQPQRLTLSTDKPAALKKAPDLSAPLYGSLRFGGKDFLIVVDEPADKDATLYVDANGNGDLTDDPPVTWTKEPRPSPTGKVYNLYMGSFMLPLPTEGGSTPVQLTAYRFDKNDPSRAPLKSTLLYYRDYGYDGNLTLNGDKYHAVLLDNAAKGDFSSTAWMNSPGIQLFIDINGNGKLNTPGKAFDAFKPFNIKGTTWQLASQWPKGPFTIAKSPISVPEIPLPPDLSKGQPAVAFKAQTMDGKDVDFPKDYKGKLVLLDFWATWCGPCMGEVPGLVKAYGTYHDKGVEYLGVSLDNPNSADKVKQVEAQQGMTWPQIYDGQGWASRVGQLYGIDSIPHPFLVDGDTGKIVAEGDVLRGDQLTKTLDDALAAKSAK